MTFTYPYFCFQIEKEDTWENSEDDDECDPEENMQRITSMYDERKDKYKRKVYN